MALRRWIGFGFNVVIFFETHVEKIEDKIEWNMLQSINKLKKHALKVVLFFAYGKPMSMY